MSTFPRTTSRYAFKKLNGGTRYKTACICPWGGAGITLNPTTGTYMIAAFGFRFDDALTLKAAKGRAVELMMALEKAPTRDALADRAASLGGK